MKFFDTHCHLQDSAFGDEWAAAWLRARDAGVAAAVICGYDAPSNELALRMAEDQPGLLPAVGFHPHEAGGVTAEMLAELETQAALPAVVAVGEIGLDYYRDLAPQDAQRRLLERQLEIALAVGKPVSVHSRGAEEAIAAQLVPFAEEFTRRYPGAAPGVMHCFGGTFEQAGPFLEAGFLVSISAAVTYPGNHEARRLAASLPLDRIVVETDSPYLPPQTHRGRRNEPMYVRAAAEAVAAARGVNLPDVAEATTANAARLLSVAAETPAEAAAC